MPLFKHSLDLPPSPRGSYDALREEKNMLALGEQRTLFARLYNFLRPFQPEKIVDATGRKLTVLATPQGKDPVSSRSGQPFGLFIVEVEEGTQIRINSSTLAGGSSTDLGFSPGDDPPYLLPPAAGVVQGGISINGATGEITSRWIEIKPSLSPNTDTTFYVEIGTIGNDGSTWHVANSRYGPIDARICRNWFASSAPFYGVTFTE